MSSCETSEESSSGVDTAVIEVHTAAAATSVLLDDFITSLDLLGLTFLHGSVAHRVQ